MKRRTNSPFWAAVAVIGWVLSLLWLGWRGVLVYTVAFFIGGLGTIQNIRRRGGRLPR